MPIHLLGIPLEQSFPFIEQLTVSNCCETVCHPHYPALQTLDHKSVGNQLVVQAQCKHTTLHRNNYSLR